MCDCKQWGRGRVRGVQAKTESNNTGFLKAALDHLELQSSGWDVGNNEVDIFGLIYMFAFASEPNLFENLKIRATEAVCICSCLSCNTIWLTVS